MDDFRRLKDMYPTASPRELAESQVFAKAVAERREDGRGSEDRSEDNREDTGDDRRRGKHSSRKDSKDPRERRPGSRPSAGPRYVCMYVCTVITYSTIWTNQVRLPILVVVS